MFEASEILQLPYDGSLSLMKLDEPFDHSGIPLASELLASQLLASDKMASDKMASDKMASDKMASDETASDKMASDKMASELLFSREACPARKPRPTQGELSGKSLRGNYISNTDRNKGFQAEQAFAAKMEALGLQCFTLPHFSHNYLLHVDFEVEGPTIGPTAMEGPYKKNLWVDVKSAKALRKTRNKDDPYNKPQDRYVCIELNAKGSLYGGHADYFAFGLTDGTFLLADRKKLVACVNEKMKKPKYRSAWPETALWCPYVRTYEGVSLVMTYMDLYDLPIECKI